MRFFKVQNCQVKVYELGDSTIPFGIILISKIYCWMVKEILLTLRLNIIKYLKFKLLSLVRDKSWENDI